jgi:hypothetical protein
MFNLKVGEKYKNNAGKDVVCTACITEDCYIVSVENISDCYFISSPDKSGKCIALSEEGETLNKELDIDLNK